MANKVDDYDEQVRKEFESTQETTETKETTVKNLGKVEFRDYDSNADPEIQRIKKTMDYVNIPLDCLPSKGRFYPENTRISIRAARAGEIREFSMIDEENSEDIRDKMTYIMSQCTKLYYGNVPGNFKDILENDRIILVLKIRELTFLDGQSSIKIKVPAGACKTPGCHPQETVDFSTAKIQFKKPSEKLEKYYDPVERCYNVQTKSFGSIKIYSPTIGVTSAVLSWINQQRIDRKDIASANVELIPYLVRDWRGFGDKQIFDKLTEMDGWSIEKFALVDRLKEEATSIDIEYELTETCAQCGGELKIPITFPEGFRSLFVPTISDLGDELL